MKETNNKNLLKQIYRKFGNGLESDYYIQKEKAKELFCVGFRHDMDNINKDTLKTFVEKDRELRAQSTCFFLTWQIREMAEEIKNLNRDKYEIGLHSEGRPLITLSLGQFTKLVEKRYRKNLRHQVKYFRRKGFDIRGHAPHAINNYLGFNNYMDWGIIENASIGVRIKYISSWRIPARTVDGEDFPRPDSPYFLHDKGEKILVLPTSWDDKFFFPTDRNGTKNDINKAYESVIRQINICKVLKAPFIINIHPQYWIDNVTPTVKFKKSIISYCKGEKIKIYTLKEIGEELWRTS